MLKVDPGNTEARVLYGETLRRLKDYPAARTMLREGVAGRKPYDEGRLLIARASVERSDGSDRLAASLAWKGWLRIAQLDMLANERLKLARKTADFWGAIENRPVQRSTSKAVVDKTPWRADAWSFRALTQLADSRTEEGCVAADKALKMDPNFHESHGAKAKCESAKRRYPDARKSLSKAIELAPGEDDKRAYKRRLRILR